MSAPIPILSNLTTPPGFPEAVRAWVKQEAKRQRDAGKGQRVTPADQMHFTVLHGLVEYLSTQCLDPLDQRLVALAAISRAVIENERDRGELNGEAPTFLSTTGQRRILALIGEPQNLPASPPEQVLQELAAAGAQDLVELARTGRDRLRSVAQEAKEATDAAVMRAEAIEVDQAAFDQARREVDSLRKEIVERDKIVEQLQLRLGDRDVPRRIKVETGIWRDPRNGAFEAWTPTGAKGKKPGFVRVESLDAARALRAESTGEPQPPASESPEGKAAFDPDDALEAALDAREKELGRELTEEDIATVEEELQPSMPSGGEED